MIIMMMALRIGNRRVIDPMQIYQFHIIQWSKLVLNHGAFEIAFKCVNGPRESIDYGST